MTRALLVWLLIGTPSAPANAQTPPPPTVPAPTPAAPARPDCSAAEHHQFDF